MVMIPVPPTPVTRMFHGLSRAGGRGGQIGRQNLVQIGLEGLAQLCAVDRHEGRTKAVDTGPVEVARGLVDPPLAPELRFYRRDRKTVRLFGAVAATLAHQFVDEHPLGRSGRRS